MITFKTYINEDMIFEHIYLDRLMEEAEAKESGAGQAADTKGKLHEILVGYHLQGGKHMGKHPDEFGDSPEESHEKLKTKVKPEEYERINARAKAAADDIKTKVESDGGKIHDVHWTSKPGDIHRTTGIHTTQKQDQSDLIVNTKGKGDTLKHHGVSLKVTDTGSKHVPVSNAGKEALHPEFESEQKAHWEKMHNTFPGLKELKTGPKKKKADGSNMSAAEMRKDFQRQDPEREAKMRAMNKSYLQSAAANTHKHLTSLGQHELIDHIKKQVLQSNPTPMQAEGHNHIRHTTYQAGKKEGGGFKFDSHTPSEHYAKYFDGSHHIGLEPSKGTTEIHFVATNKATGEKSRIASQRLKLNSGSDPLSSIKSSGIAAG